MKRFFTKILIFILLFSLVAISFTACKIDLKKYISKGSDGLMLLQYERDPSYYIVSMGTCTDEHVVIPAYNKKLPIKYIDNYGFANSTRLKSIVIPDTIIFIGKGAFYNCAYLENVDMSSNVGTIDKKAFANCTSLQSIEINDNVTTIGDEAFANCTALQSITLGKYAIDIGDLVFDGCTSLTEITFPEEMPLLDFRKVKGCPSLKTINVGKKINVIHQYDDSNLDALLAINVSADNPNYKSIDGVVYDKTGTILTVFPSGVNGVYKTPKYVREIFPRSFNNSNLEALFLSNSVTKLSDYSFIDSSIKTVVIENKNLSLTYKAFSDSQVETVYFTGSADEWASIFPDMDRVSFNVVYNYVVE